MDDDMLGLEAWIESIEARIVERANRYCPTCKGWGDERGTFRYCPSCGGSGLAHSVTGDYTIEGIRNNGISHLSA